MYIQASVMLQFNFEHNFEHNSYLSGSIIKINWEFEHSIIGCNKSIMCLSLPRVDKHHTGIVYITQDVVNKSMIMKCAWNNKKYHNCIKFY